MVRHPAPLALLVSGQGARRERAQHRALGPFEAQARRFIGGPVPTRIGHAHRVNGKECALEMSVVGKPANSTLLTKIDHRTADAEADCDRRG